MTILLEDQRPGTDEAHLPPENVQELRQLVERVSPQEPADPCHTRVVGNLEHASVAARVEVEVNEVGLALIRPSTIVRYL